MKQREHRSAGVACGLALALLIAGCNRPAAQSSLGADLAPFAKTRNQAIAMVTDAKRTLDAASINQLMLSYTDLQEKSNAYAGFLVEAASAGSFDSSKNDAYASQLRQSIDGFNVAYAGLESGAMVRTKSSSMWLADGWLPSFAQHVQSNWQRYHDAAGVTPGGGSIAAEIKSQTVYPNFEDIATESVRAGR
ncbi:MAG: hypothetical protein JOY86_02825 [Candidatus Eremiobacteraeota bacterium]|nr:hypothetical protein [Candidatus Eremiobacteraeota bacterium]